MSLPIVVVNPNSTQAVTDGIDEAIEPLRLEGGPPIECRTLAEGPPGIETEEHSSAVVKPLCELIRSCEANASAFVIACYSDPGLHAAREATKRPVLGIGESAMVTALTRGERFGILSILEASLPRHRRAVRRAGLEARFAGDVPIGVGVTGLSEKDKVHELLEVGGLRLRDELGADVVILGCAGMARYRKSLQEALGLPVIDPTQAAVTLAIGAVRLP
jgi:allantoin racemase